MKKLLLICLLCILMSGCVALERRPGGGYNGFSFSPDGCCGDVCSVFSCLNSISSYTAEEVSKEFSLVEQKVEDGVNGEDLRLVCLSLHPEIRYDQFRKGVVVLEDMVTGGGLPDKSVEGLSALLSLVYRLDKAKIAKWQSRKKILAERDKLAEEKSSLQAENKILADKLKREQIKAKELQAQIEELKNIEKIINKREKN